MSLLTLTGIEARHSGGAVLHNVTLAIEKGEIVTIVGPNGSGKSTLLRVMIGALQPTKGTVVRAPDLRIGYVPQTLHIDPTLPMTVRRFLDLPKRVRSSDASQALEKAGVSGVGQQQMVTLSGGQFQRVLLARAVVMVSHELHVVMSASDRVICLNGHICCEGTPDVVTAAPAYRELFGTGTKGALALYRHDHDHDHDHDHKDHA